MIGIVPRLTVFLGRGNKDGILVLATSQAGFQECDDLIEGGFSLHWHTLLSCGLFCGHKMFV